MAHRLLRTLCVLLPLSLLLTSCSLLMPKSDEELIEDRIDAFSEAYNTGDFEAVLDSLDAKTRNTYKSASKLLGGINLGFNVGGFGVSGNLDLSALFGLSVGVVSEDDLMRIEITSMEIDGEKATVYGEMTYANYSEVQPVKLLMVKEKNDWFIKDMTDAPAAETTE